LERKAGVDGRLFGSVTHSDVAEALTKLGFEVSKTQVRFPAGHVKMIGEYPVSIALHTDVVSEITLHVKAEAM
uniref:50S ribosomal protein L9 n=1 Tax=Candidatus Roseilinea sp. TaxID=2838777 RepID=UPI00404B8BB3